MADAGKKNHVLFVFPDFGHKICRVQDRQSPGQIMADAGEICFILITFVSTDFGS